MMAALTASRKEVAENTCAQARMYTRTAELYFETATRALLPPVDPPADLRPNPTSAGRIEELIKASLKRTLEIVRVRGDAEVDEGKAGKVDDVGIAALMEVEAPAEAVQTEAVRADATIVVVAREEAATAMVVVAREEAATAMVVVAREVAVTAMPADAALATRARRTRTSRNASGSAGLLRRRQMPGATTTRARARA